MRTNAVITMSTPDLTPVHRDLYGSNVQLGQSAGLQVHANVTADEADRLAEAWTDMARQIRATEREARENARAERAFDDERALGRIA